MSWLYDVYGDEFEALYESYEKAGKGRKPSKRMNCGRKLESQIETGTPYMLYKMLNQINQTKRI
jgi:ribonucleoside-diphosphate reductase alpha chain